MSAHGSSARHGGKLADDAPPMAQRPDGYEARAIMARRAERLAREARNLDPRNTLALARELLTRVADDGCSYADFEGAQYVERQVKKAARALENCS